MHSTSDGRAELAFRQTSNSRLSFPFRSSVPKSLACNEYEFSGRTRNEHGTHEFVSSYRKTSTNSREGEVIGAAPRKRYTNLCQF